VVLPGWRKPLFGGLACRLQSEYITPILSKTGISLKADGKNNGATQ